MFCSEVGPKSQRCGRPIGTERRPTLLSGNALTDECAGQTIDQTAGVSGQTSRGGGRESASCSGLIQFGADDDVGSSAHHAAQHQVPGAK